MRANLIRLVLTNQNYSSLVQKSVIRLFQICLQQRKLEMKKRKNKSKATWHLEILTKDRQRLGALVEYLVNIMEAFKHPLTSILFSIATTEEFLCQSNRTYLPNLFNGVGKRFHIQRCKGCSVVNWWNRFNQNT